MPTILREKKMIFFKLGEMNNQPPKIIHQTSLYKKKSKIKEKLGE